MVCCSFLFFIKKYKYFCFFHLGIRLVLADAGDHSIDDAKVDENVAKQRILELPTFIQWIQNVLIINPLDIKQKSNLLISSGINCIKNIYLYRLSSNLDHTNEEFTDQQKLYYRADENYIYDDYIFEGEINYAIQQNPL